MRKQVGTAAATLTYLHSDHLGSTTLATDSTGAMSSAQSYYAYGRTRGTLGSALPTDHRYTGQKYDSASGLHYYGARYYDFHVGTFISPDTIVPDPTNVFDYNRFMYVRGRVMNYNDPTGYDPCNIDRDAYCYEYQETIANHPGYHHAVTMAQQLELIASPSFLFPN